MNGIICSDCHMLLSPESSICSDCGMPIVLEGENKNIIDHLEPNCLIHRYEGSDMLEPAFIIKVGKTNLKVATKLKEYAKPVVVPKQRVYSYDSTLFDSIQDLRSKRTATIDCYDLLIQSHWQKLLPYS